jgi:hypothetical protein
VERKVRGRSSGHRAFLALATGFAGDAPPFIINSYLPRCMEELTYTLLEPFLSLIFSTVTLSSTNLRGIGKIFVGIIRATLTF